MWDQVAGVLPQAHHKKEEVAAAGGSLDELAAPCSPAHPTHLRRCGAGERARGNCVLETVGSHRGMFSVVITLLWGRRKRSL